MTGSTMLLLACLPAFGQQTPSAPDRAAVTFRQKCAGCHSIGQGQVVGPDLTIARTRTEQVNVANIKRMQDRTGPLTDAEVTDLTKLLQDPKAPERITAQEKLAAQATQKELAPPSAARGRELFEGQRRLKNGGMACASCHRVNGQGGTIARDLTDVAARLGANVLPTAIEGANFPVMKDAFKAHPITPQEAADLTAYLTSLPAATKQSTDDAVPWLALAGALVMLGVMAASYRKRNNGVRSKLRRR
ncbi:MAG: c-type cytochrome [Armatimonadota bacterium]